MSTDSSDQSREIFERVVSQWPAKMRVMDAEVRRLLFDVFDVGFIMGRLREATGPGGFEEAFERTILKIRKDLDVN